jgi:hypothetical protein
MINKEICPPLNENGFLVGSFLYFEIEIIPSSFNSTFPCLFIITTHLASDS